MVRIPGGRFQMGSNHHYPEEAPARVAAVASFWMDRTPVTNRMFARFAEDTGYRTVAEREIENLICDGEFDRRPGSLVFSQPETASCGAWWKFVRGASWRCPDGTDSLRDELLDHPVVHMALEDAMAYARWAGKTLPSEEEWEFAARGGLSGAEFAWGDTLAPGDVHMANTWQGEFPYENTLEDGFLGTSPVGSFPPNGYGLMDTIGNVWEWTIDLWQGPAVQSCAGTGDSTAVHVIKGGSYLCAPNYCRRYRPAARHPQSADSGTSHIGFRCIIRERAS